MHDKVETRWMEDRSARIVRSWRKPGIWRSPQIKFPSTETRNLGLFFLLAFAWSWLLWLTPALRGIGFLAPFGPTIAALLLTTINEGWQGTKVLLKRGVDLSFNKVWLLPIFLLMPAIVGLSLLLAVLSGDSLPEMPVLTQPWTVIPAFFYILLLGGPLAEEFGWRGYALDRLQARFGALVASVTLGLVWGLWHLPLFLAPGDDPYHTMPFWAFVLGAVLFSILFTWIYNNAGRSVLAVILFHTTGNLAHFIFPAVATTWGGLYSLVLNVVVAILIVAFPGASYLGLPKCEKSSIIKP